MLETKTPPPPKYKKKFPILQASVISFFVVFIGFLILNHFAALLVICTPAYSTPYLCEEIGNTRIITFVSDLMKK